MTTIKLDVLFKKIQKDDKKENLEMHIISDTVPYQNELMEMAGGMVVLQISECKELPAHFKAMQRDSKKVTLKFEVKGNHTERILEMYKWAGGSTVLHLAQSQLSIDDVYEEPRDGLDFNLDTSGVVTLAEGQLSIDEVEQDELEEQEIDKDFIEVFQVEPDATEEPPQAEDSDRDNELL